MKIDWNKAKVYTLYVFEFIVLAVVISVLKYA